MHTPDKLCHAYGSCGCEGKVIKCYNRMCTLHTHTHAHTVESVVNNLLESTVLINQSLLQPKCQQVKCEKGHMCVYLRL